MSLTWKSIGHAFASGFSSIVRGSKYMESALVKVEGSEKTVEKLSALIPGYGPVIVEVEQLGYAALGMLVGGLHYSGAAFEQNLLNSGSDQTAIDTIKALIVKYPSLVADVEAVFGKPQPGTIAAVAIKPPTAVAVPLASTIPVK